MASSETAKVDTPNHDYTTMAAKWPLIDALLSGTSAMREAGELFLPREPKESHEAYKCRIRRSFLFAAFGDAIDRIVSKPFSKPVILKGKYPKIFDEMARNIDNCGKDLTQFARSVFQDGVAYGLSHIYVEHPVTGGNLTLRDEKELGIRPYFVHYKHEQPIGWRAYRNMTTGKFELSNVRLKEDRMEPEGEFGEVKIEIIREVTELQFREWRKGPKDKEFVAQLAQEHSFGSVPLVSFYTDDTGFMTANPPLEDVAYLNLCHWQSYSDQRNILRFARVGMMFGAGFTEDEVEKGFSIGPTNMILSVNPEAKLTIVEHTGAAIGAGKTDLDDIESKMDGLGLRPFIDQKGNPTATGKTIDESKTYSSILSWIRSLECALRSAFMLAAKWKNVESEVGEDFDVDIHSDFGISVQTIESIQNLISARIAGEISRSTFLNEIKRRGLLGDTVVIDEEMKRIGDEPPPMQQGKAADPAVQDKPKDQPKDPIKADTKTP